MKKISLLAASVAAFTAFAPAAPAMAAAPTTCVGYTTTILNGWTACAGFYDQNIFSNTSGNIALQQEGVNHLGGTFDGDFNALFGFPSLGNNSDGPRTIQFGRTFFGKTIIGAHFGNIGLPQDAYSNVSVFYLFDFGSAGASSLNFVQSRGLSNLYVYNGNAVPEPGTWALLILGFGVLGAALRKRSQARPALIYS